MKKIFLSSLVTLLVLALMGCKKNAPNQMPGTVGAKCLLTSETDLLTGNEKKFDYQYDDKGLLTSVTATTLQYSAPLGTYATAGSGVTYSYPTNVPGKTGKIITIYDQSATNVYNELPTKASVSITIDDTLKTNYYTYFFFYNDKKQLVKVGEQTDYIVGDWEYDLNISYNDQGNVSQLAYEWTTGPRDITIYTVTAYDDKPTPYAGVKGWPFFTINFAWNNYDPEPIITALSKNNPLNYSTGSGSTLFTREMSYTYNSNGFPIERDNTNKNINGTYTFSQNFAYNCK